MDTRTIILADSSQDVREVFKAVFEMPDYNLKLASSSSDALSKVFSENPDIIVIGADANDPRSNEIIRTIRANSSTSQIPALVILAEDHSDIRKLYSSEGECVFMIKPLTPTKIKGVIEEHIKGKNLFGCKLSTKIITFSGVRGGAGTTTLAANTAISMLGNDKSVVLLETSNYFPGIKPVLNVSSKNTVPFVMAEDPGLITRELIEQYITVHESGLKNIPTIASIADMEKINAEAIKFMRYNLSPIANFSVFDAGYGLNEASLELFDISDKVIFVATLDLPSLYNLELVRQVFEGTRIGLDKCGVVFNHIHSTGEIPEASIRNLKLHMPILGFIPNHTVGFLKAMNDGTPFVRQFPRAASTKAIKTLADDILKSLESREAEKSAAA